MSEVIKISRKTVRKAVRIAVRLLLAVACGLAISFLSPAMPPQVFPTPLWSTRKTNSVAQSVLAAGAPTPAQQHLLPLLVPPPSTQEVAPPNPPQELPTPLSSNLVAENVAQAVLTAIGPSSAQRNPFPRQATPPSTHEQARPNPPQQLVAPPSSSRRTQSFEQPRVTAPTAALAPQEPMAQQAPPPSTPEQALPSAPQVSYEAGQLTINAENATLADVMSLVHTLMGADIDLPASASGERIWVRLGPGPARKVLATLLGGTTLDFVIQASNSDTDPDGIQSVILTPRTSGPATSTRAAAPAARPLPPRLSDTERRVTLPNHSAAETRVAEEPVPPAPVPEPAVSTDAAPVVPQSVPQPAPTGVVAASDAQASEAINPSTAPKDQMMQSLQNMYEQRKQMQLARTPSGTN